MEGGSEEMAQLLSKPSPHRQLSSPPLGPQNHIQHAATGSEHRVQGFAVGARPPTPLHTLPLIQYLTGFQAPAPVSAPVSIPDLESLPAAPQSLHQLQSLPQWQSLLVG